MALIGVVVVVGGVQERGERNGPGGVAQGTAEKGVRGCGADKCLSRSGASGVDARCEVLGPGP